MVEKIKVSREVADAIDWVKNNANFENAMFIQSNESWAGDSLVVLNDLKVEELARLLIIGYEIEETPEEKALVYYEELGKRNLEGIRRHIANVLTIAEIKIKGIND